MNFFETEEPYRIADKITNESILSPDLVAHVFFIMEKRNDIDNEPAFFSRCAYQQWTWSNSEFNRLHRVNEIRFEDDGNIIDPIDEEIIDNGSKYMEFFRDYMNKKPNTTEEWFKIKVGQMVLDGDTYRDIEKKTKLNKRYIHETIKQLKHDIYSSFYGVGNWDDSDIDESSEH